MKNEPNPSVPSEPPPKIIYKFVPPERADVLENRRIRFTPPNKLNDPFEGSPYVKQIASDDFVTEFLNKEFDAKLAAEIAKCAHLLSTSKRQEVDAFGAALKKRFLPTFREFEPDAIYAMQSKLAAVSSTLGILCLGATWKPQLMWAHYANGHLGFAIGFDSSHPFFNTRRSQIDEFGHLIKVEYKPERPKVDLSNTNMTEWFATKHLDWEYECEWRMFRPLAENTEVRSKETDPIHLFAFPSEVVLEIVLGSKCSAVTEAKIRGVISTWTNKPAFYRASLDPADYTLHRNKV